MLNFDGMKKSTDLRSRISLRTIVDKYERKASYFQAFVGFRLITRGLRLDSIVRQAIVLSKAFKSTSDEVNLEELEDQS